LLLGKPLLPNVGLICGLEGSISPRSENATIFLFSCVAAPILVTHTSILVILTDEPIMGKVDNDLL